MTRYPASVRARVLLRSFLIQGSWNYETLIGPGFAFTLLPALRYLHKQRGESGVPQAGGPDGATGETLEQAVARHVELFNSHPYFATVAVGAVAKMEADGTPPAIIERFKLALRGSLGSLGDRLVWSAWRPMTAIIGVVLFLAGAPWWAAVASFLIVYNSLHFAVRYLGLRMGARSGLDLGGVLREAPIQPVAERASQIACALIGLAVVLAVSVTENNPGRLAMAVVAVALGLALGSRTRKILTGLLWAAVAFALLLGLLGYGA
ncbi:MAG: PTS system mannose/fructose/sorbose family transporter subunit IID [Gemmatimonadota bacterium]|jgi:PTS system mannose-specific IID component|nr:PTS system mannose/fructose/sorbose family transporter subunit IID [Gemmatimonadota bacterium]